MTDTTSKNTDTSKATDEGRASTPKYVGSRVSMKQYKLWLANARKGPNNCPKLSRQYQTHGQRAAIRSLLEIKPKHINIKRLKKG